MRSLLLALILFVACAPAAPMAERRPGTPEPRAAAGLVEVSAGGPGDAALSRCLESPGSKPAVRLELEPHAAVDPADPGHLVAAWIVNAGPDTGAIAAAASFDGGRSWTPPRTLPVNACAGGPFDFLPRASDPWVAIGPAGRAYVSAVAYQPTSGADAAGAVIVVASADGGRTWEAPAAASLSRTPEVYHDNTAIAADPRHPGTAYVLTTRYEEPAGGGRIGPATLAKTIDGGKTWSPARAISPRAPGSPPADAPQMVIDPRTGHLFVFYTHGPRGSSMSFLRSEDGGASWSPPAPVVTGIPLSAEPTYLGTGKELRIGPDIGHAAIDPRTGRLYAVFTNGWATGGRSLEVGLVTSGDGGTTWSAPLRVSAGTDPMAWRPALAIDSRGRVAVSWFTPTPGEPAQGDRLPVSVHLAEIRLQPDGSLARGEDAVIDTFAWTPSPRGAYFLGDYNPLLAGRGGFLPLYGRSTQDGSRIVIIPAP
jgi:hypothetical protein